MTSAISNTLIFLSFLRHIACLLRNFHTLEFLSISNILRTQLTEYVRNTLTFVCCGQFHIGHIHGKCKQINFSQLKSKYHISYKLGSLRKAFFFNFYGSRFCLFVYSKLSSS